jgi:hypothetical protein
VVFSGRLPAYSHGGAPAGTLRHALVRVVPMMSRVPFTGPSPDPDDRVGEPSPPEPLAIIRKVTFQWPPDCVWLFMDRESDSDA